MGKPLEDTRNLVVGSTAVLLDGERSNCRTRECNSGKIYATFLKSIHSGTLSVIAKQLGNTLVLETILGKKSNGPPAIN